MAELKDNVKYIRVNDGRCDTEVSVDTLRAEKCCYTYKVSDSSLQFKGKLGLIYLSNYDSREKNVDGHSVGLEGVIGSLVLKKGELVKSKKDENALALYFPQLVYIE